MEYIPYNASVSKAFYEDWTLIHFILYKKSNFSGEVYT